MAVNLSHVGFLDFLGIGGKRLDQLRAPLPIASPWGTDGSLSKIVVADILGADLAATMLPMSRELAITVPAVSRARNLLVGQIQRYPLVAMDENGPLADQPTFLYRTNNAVTPTERLAWTVDDLIFHGMSLWLVERGAAGQILNAAWCPYDLWSIDNGAIILSDADGHQRELTDTEYILINSPFEGLLGVAGRTIRGALDTENAWVGRMRNPIPAIEIRITNDDNLEDDEIEDLVKAWAKARTAPNGAVSYTPPGVEIVTHGEVKADLYTEGRNAIRTDIGSFTNIPTSMMDGSLAEASLTYVTQEGNRNRFIEESIPFWTVPIESALSQDNVVPRGQRVRFDRSEDYSAIPTPTGIPEQD